MSRIIKKENSEYYSGDGFSGQDYIIPDKDINLAVIKINGISPKKGYQVNTDCKELVYIIKGEGKLYIKDNNVINFKEGDLIIIEKGECYQFVGNFEAVVPCTPAWTSEQHKYVD